MIDADSLPRLMKVLLDSGEAESIEAAQAKFAKYGMVLRLDEAVFDNESQQITALTALNCGSRTVLGNIVVEGDLNRPLSVHGFSGRTLAQVMSSMGIDATRQARPEWPIINISRTDDGGVRPWADGWRFGLGGSWNQGPAIPAACVAAAGLAVSEAFSLLRQDNRYAGRRNLALSVWNMIDGEALQGPVELPTIPPVWLVGLGHLGQAYAWTLGFTPACVDIFLQDVDLITLSTVSTSLLSLSEQVGVLKKTRAVSTWLEARGFRTSVVERRFNADQRIGLTEPTIALFGVDNAPARRAMEQAGFRFIIDAGLGAGHRSFREVRLRTFPGPAKAEMIWSASSEEKGTVEAPAYQQLLRNGQDPCGITTLATRAVGAPFVGCVAAGFALGQLLRHSMDQPAAHLIDVNLRDPSRSLVFLNDRLPTHF